MHFDTHKAITCYRFFDHDSNARSVALRINKSESIKAIRPAIDDTGHLLIGQRVVGMKGREQHRAINSGSRGAPQVLFQGRVGVPWTSQPIASSSMTVAINDHR